MIIIIILFIEKRFQGGVTENYCIDVVRDLLGLIDFVFYYFVLIENGQCTQMYNISI